MIQKIHKFLSGLFDLPNIGVCNKCEYDAPGCWEFEERCPRKHNN